MEYIILGCLAFIFLYIFDINKIWSFHKAFNIFFAIGILLLGGATLGLLISSFQDFTFSWTARLLFGVVGVIFLYFQLYALFIALPFKETYVDISNRGNQVTDKGMYALSRHPGVICFFSFFLFLWLASGKMIILWAGLVWTIMDIIHVYVQDRWIFPITLNGYNEYKKTTPFLVPNYSNLRNFLFALLWRNPDESGTKN